MNQYLDSKAPFNMELNTLNLVRDGAGPKSARCWHCKKPGHKRQKCPDIECFGCGERGHVVAMCTHVLGDNPGDVKGAVDVAFH